MFVLNKNFISLSHFKKIEGTGQTDGRTDGRVQHLMQPFSNGRIYQWMDCRDSCVVIVSQ